MSSVLSTNLHYFDNIYSFGQILNSDEIILLTHLPYTKSSLKNKTHILTANGPLMLSIPIAGGRNNRAAYHEIEIFNNHSWQKNHWHSIISAYNNSPYFEHYMHLLLPLYEQQYTSLFQFNMACLKAVFKALKCQKTISLSHEIGLSGNEIANPSNFKETYHVPSKKYPQVFNDRFDFVPNLSILDLLCNIGPKTIDFLS